MKIGYSELNSAEIQHAFRGARQIWWLFYMERYSVKNTAASLLFLLTLSLIGCKQTNVQPETIHTDRLNKWQPILLKNGDNFEYQTKALGTKATVTTLSIKQETKNSLQALWEVKQEETIILSKQVLASPENILISSKAALITEKNTTPFLSTVLMHWWPGIDYFRWEVGFKRAVLVDMLAGFMIEVIKECNVADIDGFLVKLKVGKTLMAEACLSPTIPLPLSVKHYHSSGGGLMYETKLLNYYHNSIFKHCFRLTVVGPECVKTPKF